MIIHIFNSVSFSIHMCDCFHSSHMMKSKQNILSWFHHKNIYTIVQKLDFLFLFLYFKSSTSTLKIEGQLQRCCCHIWRHLLIMTIKTFKLYLFSIHSILFDFKWIQTISWDFYTRPIDGYGYCYAMCLFCASAADADSEVFHSLINTQQQNYMNVQWWKIIWICMFQW